jgi:hypothetical protein
MQAFAQYWRDFEALEAWSRSEPHRAWWISFLRNSGGTGFWHETYFMRGGIEAVFDDMPKPIGLLRFAPHRAAKDGMFTARQRAAATNAASFTVGEAPAPVVAENEIDDMG